MSSLSEHLYKVSGGNILRGVKTISATSFPSGAGSSIIHPSSGKKMIIMQIMVSPLGTGANGTVSVGLSPSDTSATEDEILFGQLFWSAQFPIIFDLSACPILTSANQALKAKLGGTGATNASVFAMAYEV